ncbi:MAG TPA: ABC transporter substrate-binding protein [Stellaceae bacterium]|jgi:putative ABC transport system substrate-binding protein
MRRRTLLIGSVGAAALLAPHRLHAKLRIPTVGVLDIGDPATFLTTFRDAIKAHGYADGQNFRLEVRTAAGDVGRLKGLAEELAGLPVDVITAHLTPSARAAAAATKTIPIVMVGVGAPLETGLIASLSRPGGNITGTSATSAELGGKRVQLIGEILPSFKRLAILANASDPFSKPFIAEIEEAGRKLGIATDAVMLKTADDLAGAFAATEQSRADAAIAQGSLPVGPVAAMALQHRIPLVATLTSGVRGGALMTYAASQSEMFRKTAAYVEKLLKGAKPADLPVEEPTEFTLVLNLKTAKALGLSIPAAILARADEVIE